MRLVLIDNYDSFTFNLYQLFCEFDLDVLVFRHDKISAEAVSTLEPHWIVISPGPKSPAHSGISKDVVRRYAGAVPILGVCLGMQVINEVYGGCTERAPVPVHGKTSLVHHRGEGLFSGLPSPFRVARYHSLQCRVTSPDLRETAWADDGVLMALEHKSLPVWGVQFHPESFLSQYGLEIAARFLASRKDFQKAVPSQKEGESRFPRWKKAQKGQEGGFPLVSVKKDEPQSLSESLTSTSR
ncbi:MAG: aminodeoxychorismate/anthranilate synthase component II [Desulfosoma sp.]